MSAWHILKFDAGELHLRYRITLQGMPRRCCTEKYLWAIRHSYTYYCKKFTGLLKLQVPYNDTPYNKHLQVFSRIQNFSLCLQYF